MLLAALPLAIELSSEARQAATVPGPPAQSAEFFETAVRPILVASCYDCHAEEQLGGLRLDSREAMLKGGTSGPAIVPGDPDRSLMIQAVRQTSDRLKMPKGGRLQPREVEALVEWVRTGAVWPAAAESTPAAPSVAAYTIAPERRAFWSFLPIRKPPVPAVKRAEWAKTGFDFPSPNLSAEKRFTTSVPLQRLFFMNSDFMQQQGELLARRVAAEPDNTARIQKTYRLIFGRAATDAEVKAGSGCSPLRAS
jgi:hypothetical protein